MTLSSMSMGGSSSAWLPVREVQTRDGSVTRHLEPNCQVSSGAGQSDVPLNVPDDFALCKLLGAPLDAEEHFVLLDEVGWLKHGEEGTQGPAARETGSHDETGTLTLVDRCQAEAPAAVTELRPDALL